MVILQSGKDIVETACCLVNGSNIFDFFISDCTYYTNASASGLNLSYVVYTFFLCHVLF